MGCSCSAGMLVLFPAAAKQIMWSDLSNYSGSNFHNHPNDVIIKSGIGCWLYWCSSLCFVLVNALFPDFQVTRTTGFCLHKRKALLQNYVYTDTSCANQNQIGCFPILTFFETISWCSTSAYGVTLYALRLLGVVTLYASRLLGDVASLHMRSM